MFVVAQVAAVLIVLGSYFTAEYLRVWRPRHDPDFAVRAPEADRTGEVVETDLFDGLRAGRVDDSGGTGGTVDGQGRR